MNYLLSFFRPEVLFQMYPAPLEGIGLKILMTIFSACIAGGIVLAYIIRSKRFDSITNKGLRKLRTLLFTMGIIGFLYVFFAYEAAPILSARIWFLAWFVGVLVWLIFCLKYFTKILPNLRAEKESKKAREKYIPR